MLRLGECYLKGIGTHKDRDAAEFYFADAKGYYESLVNQAFYYQKQLDKTNQLLKKCKKI